MRSLLLVFIPGFVLTTAAQDAAPPLDDKPAPEKAEAGRTDADKAEADADAKEEKEPGVPEDLLEDEHLREELGVNQFTAPSIRKIFGSLDLLGQLPYEKLKRDVPKSAPQERWRVALAAQSEKVDDLENIGRAVLRHAKVLAAGARVTEHAKAILENSATGDWKSLREDLAATQKDVEAEMVLLRDVEMAHLISIGGWLRGLEIASTTALDPFSAERAATLARKDLAEYFSATLADFDPALTKLPQIVAIRTGIDEIRVLLDLPEGKPFEQAQVQQIHDKAVALVKLITGAKP
jgi:hypothetical protein